MAWLEVDFTSYLEDARCESLKVLGQPLTTDIYGANNVTSSAIAVIEYILTDLRNN